jgi:Ricin-type beta-trefoil lectin domain
VKRLTRWCAVVGAAAVLSVMTASAAGAQPMPTVGRAATSDVLLTIQSGKIMPQTAAQTQFAATASTCAYCNYGWQNGGNGLCIDLYQQHVTYGQPVVAWPCNTSDAGERWNVTQNSDGTYKFRYHNNTSWCMQDDGNHGGTVLEPCSGYHGVDWARYYSNTVFDWKNKYLTSVRGTSQWLNGSSQGNKEWVGSSQGSYSDWYLYY